MLTWGTIYGRLAEWSIAAVLKTDWSGDPRREGSTPSSSTLFPVTCGSNFNLEKCQRGRMAHLGKVMVAAMRRKGSTPFFSSRSVEACQSPVYWRCLESRWS